ncbi:MAG: nicotinamide mononucleotide transporter [Thiomicrorhabdus sp.]|nr:MAG: nicotinamide mononucleotide transporter [Thiomicrorhabdus sp.]
MPVDENLFTSIISSLLGQSGWEWLAASLGIIYVILASKESIWCWPTALLSTLIYTLLFWEGQLPMQSILNAYYMAMAVYGFILWRKQAESENTLRITARPIKFHIIFVGTGVVLTGLIGFYLSNNAEARMPYLDAAVTVFSVMNTILMARKVIENWLYWIVIDAAAIVLYLQTGYYVTIIMFLVYLVLAVYGYLNWKKLQQKAALAT